MSSVWWGPAVAGDGDIADVTRRTRRSGRRGLARSLRRRPSRADVALVASALGSVRVVRPGHIECGRCEFRCSWSGGMTGPDPALGSESLGTYLLLAQHDCAAAETRPEHARV